MENQEQLIAVNSQIRKSKIAYVFDKYGEDVIRDIIADDVRQNFSHIEDEDLIADIIDTVIEWALREE